MGAAHATSVGLPLLLVWISGCSQSPGEHCTNRYEDFDESDFDCGGATCEPCAIGRACRSDDDCVQGGVCLGSICRVPRCDDRARDGDETDVDCGGSMCGACPGGSACRVATDCAKGVCSDGRCQECDDRVREGDETDIDCGGSRCPPCRWHQACLVAGDCLSGSCTGGLCVPGAACANRVRDGGESDVDCGGGCAPCEDGKACNSRDDCIGLRCAVFAAMGRRCSGGCSNGVLDGNEAFVDCGGTECDPCCVADGDCAPQVCRAGHCVSSCGDGMRSGQESDVDCGGPECTRCSSGRKCRGDDDCASGLCQAGSCAAWACGGCGPGAGLSCSKGACVCDKRSGCAGCCSGLGRCAPGNRYHECGGDGARCFPCMGTHTECTAGKCLRDLSAYCSIQSVGACAQPGWQMCVPLTDDTCGRSCTPCPRYQRCVGVCR